MKEKITYALWAVLFTICAALGFVQNATGFGRVLLIMSSLIFFIPGVLLLYWGQRKAVRLISICSLGITLILFVANILSVQASATVGNVLNALLVILSSPVYCSQFPAFGMFLWACLLMMTFLKPPKIS